MNNKHQDRTTDQEDWAAYYGSRKDEVATWDTVNEADFRNLPYTSLMNYLGRYMQGGNVIEVGAGDSHLLIDLQKRFQPLRAVGLDYLPQA